jgi:hypothetical protein
VYSALVAGRGTAILAVVGLAGVLLLGLGLRLGWTALIPASLGVLGAGYAAALLLRDGGVDGGAPLVAAAALLAAELGYWTVASNAVPVDAALVRRSLATSGALAFVAFCLGTILLLVGGAGIGGGLPLEALGVAAAASALAVVARLARA